MKDNSAAISEVRVDQCLSVAPGLFSSGGRDLRWRRHRRDAYATGPGERPAIACDADTRPKWLDQDAANLRQKGFMVFHNPPASFGQASEKVPGAPLLTASVFSVLSWNDSS